MLLISTNPEMPQPTDFTGTTDREHKTEVVELPVPRPLSRVSSTASTVISHSLGKPAGELSSEGPIESPPVMPSPKEESEDQTPVPEKVNAESPKSTPDDHTKAGCTTTTTWERWKDSANEPFKFGSNCIVKILMTIATRLMYLISLINDKCFKGIKIEVPITKI